MPNIYEIIVNRYKDLIEKSEEKTISEIRQLINPNHSIIQRIKEEIGERDVGKIVDYLKEYETISIPVTFWLTFEEIEELRGGTIMDKAIFLTSLLRAFDYNAKVFVTSKKVYVSVEDKEPVFIDPNTWSIYRGIDVQKIVSEEVPQYAFNDLVFESFEE